MENNRVLNALDALYNNTDNSKLLFGEKNALEKLIECLKCYFINECNKINNSIDVETINHHLSLLYTRMTDYIVAINDTLKGKNDAYSIVNFIYKEINYDDKKGRFKRKRLI